MRRRLKVSTKTPPPPLYVVYVVYDVVYVAYAVYDVVYVVYDVVYVVYDFYL